MAPQAQDRLKSRLEVWLACLAIGSFIASPAAAYITFKVQVETRLDTLVQTVTEQSERIKVLEEERINIARSLARIEAGLEQIQRGRQ